MKNQELARLFFREVMKVNEDESISLTEKIEALYRQLNHLFVEATSEEQLQFTTLFARIAFAGHKFNLSRQLQFFIHEYRRHAVNQVIRQKKETVPMEVLYKLGIKAVSESISAIYEVEIPEDLDEIVPPFGFYKQGPTEIKSFIPSLRVAVLEIDPTKAQMLVRAEEHSEKDIWVQYNIADRNENFNPSIKVLQYYFDLPVIVNLLDIEVDKEGVFRPKGFVIEPDYLMDVTAVAECFKDFGAEPMLYLLKKYLPFTYSTPLMIGNIANFFLDELMSNPEIGFREIFPKVFRLNPLAFSIFSDRDIREIMDKCQKHFVNLKTMVHQGFAKNDIEIADCFLEPSFYSEAYGLQGRLDIFHHKAESKNNPAIVELKSGKTFKPNKWGLNHNHYIQTMLYDLMIKSVFKNEFSPTNFILYSGADDRNLRFAPVTKAQQYEALNVRNQLVAIEYALAKGETRLLNRLSPKLLPSAKGFVARDMTLFEKVYQGMTVLEQKYFNTFSSFIAKEHKLAKTGVQGIEKINGLASLWLNDFEEKRENYEILSHLEINQFDSKAAKPVIVFNRSEGTNPLANFRKGDIAVLYPFIEKTDTVLNNQIFKCSITAMDEHTVTVQLRSPQFNTRLFDAGTNWNIEHDLFDSSFTGMYRGLFQFAQFPDYKKELLLTLNPPKQPEEIIISPPKELTEEQGMIFQKALSAKDYFLLWGPPGTGKTSMMLKNMVGYLLNETDENILLLAYTNRAVDEICGAIDSLDKLAHNEYIRVGSRNSTHEKYHDRLLNTLLDDVNNRAELKELLESHRIFVATVASMANKQELMHFKKFQRVIIDEASQILEPMVIGMLPFFERFILIGDHQQLPAIVVQDKRQSEIEDEDLKAIGLTDCRNSLFERLYKRCIAENWNWAYAQLSHQGRMHEEVMEFSSEQFYKSALKVLPKGSQRHIEQTRGIDWRLPEPPTKLEEQLSMQRVLFVPTPTDLKKGNKKTNRPEAEMIAELVKSFQRIFEENGKPFTASSLGIITPYRAQIAQIKQVLEEQGIDPAPLTIDTVERYQGGARDIILLSLCANHVSQMSSLVSLSDEGVDRKLNVAMTRAREHLVIVGNEEVLGSDEIYSKLMEYGKAIVD